MKTFMQTKEEGFKAAKWHIVDAAGLPVGRIASEVASLIRGKHKRTFTRHVDGGDFVVVVNAERAVFTGAKLDKKVYYHHTGYFGGLKERTARHMLEEKPERVIEFAVKGMLPKGPLGRRLQRKLKVYAGAEHPHGSQRPEKYELKYVSAK
jgi:large subunit ribosomal protein L13